MRSHFGDNSDGNAILLKLEEMLKNEQPLEVEDLTKLMEQLKHFSTKLPFAWRKRKISRKSAISTRQTASRVSGSYSEIFSETLRTLAKGNDVWGRHVRISARLAGSAAAGPGANGFGLAAIPQRDPPPAHRRYWPP